MLSYLNSVESGCHEDWAEAIAMDDDRVQPVPKATTSAAMRLNENPAMELCRTRTGKTRYELLSGRDYINTAW